MPLDGAAAHLDHPTQRLHHRVVRHWVIALIGDDDTHVVGGLRRHSAQSHHQRCQPIARQQDVGPCHLA